MLQLLPLRRLRAASVAALLCCFSFASTLDAAQCNGTTREGNRCRNQGDASGYCGYHNPSRANRCSATTRDGSPCRNPQQPGSSYCRVHG